MSERNRGRVLFALCALLIASAASADVAGTNASQDPPINVNDGKPRWRWIGERTMTSMACPNTQPPLANWSIKPLFCVPQNPGDPDGACISEGQEQGVIPPGLRAFCAYEYTPATAVPQSDIDKLKALVPAKLTKVAQDSMAVGSAGSGLQDETWQALFTHFKEEVGLPSSRPVPLEQSPLVRLAAIDTQPTNVGAPDLMDHRSPHGHALVNIADELLCNNNVPRKCAATLASRLTLGYVCFDRKLNQPNCRDPVRGGWIGTIGHLARSIRLEVRDWLDPGVPGRRLVLNLSVAWHPRFGGLQSNLNNMPSPVRAVYAAIADAECRGAVAIAAAGNLTGRKPADENGPMLPAAWEQRRAPDLTDCTNRLSPATPPDIYPSPGPDNRPLVYAVGGVRGDGTTLANARPSAEPSLVAYADHADTDDALGPAASTATLTGSSVAALVVSSAAAATWFFADHLPVLPLKPFEIMDLLYDNGLPVFEEDGVTPREADFCVGGTTANPCPVATDVREVQICTSIDAIAGTATCPTVNPLNLAITDSGFIPVSLSTLSASLPPDPTCGPGTIHYAPGPVPANPCPLAQYYSLAAEPWQAGPDPQTDTQPGETPCPNCGTRAQARTPTPTSSTFYLEVDDAHMWSLTDATLQCGDSFYSLTNSLASDFPDGTLGPGDKVAITLDVAPDCAPGSPMLIHFRDEDGESVVNAVLEGT